MSIKIVCSDMHFGDKDCSLYSDKISRSLWEFWASLGQIDELILAGDILEANLSSLTKAIEGKRNERGAGRIGFKGWLHRMVDIQKLSVDRIVYIPGNHDYVIFDYLATERAFVHPISKGESILSDLPIIRADFETPFIRGIVPISMRNNFVVSYPDYELSAGNQNILITHGHYLDYKQTLLKDLETRIQENQGDVEKAVREFFIATAQYQTMVRAASYMESFRESIGSAYKSFDKLFNALKETVNNFGLIRNSPMNNQLLFAIATYIKYFRRLQSEVPDVFIFGHTHVPGQATIRLRTEHEDEKLVDKEISIYNTGAFLNTSKQAGSFLVINSQQIPENRYRIYQMKSNGQINSLKS